MYTTQQQARETIQPPPKSGPHAHGVILSHWSGAGGGITMGCLGVDPYRSMPCGRLATKERRTTRESPGEWQASAAASPRLQLISYQQTAQASPPGLVGSVAHLRSEPPLAGRASLPILSAL